MVSVQIRTVKQNALALIQFGNATREPADHFVKIIFWHVIPQLLARHFENFVILTADENLPKLPPIAGDIGGSTPMSNSANLTAATSL